MTKRTVSPVLIVGLALVMVLAAGCFRPDAQATLEAPVPGVQQPQSQQPTLPPPATATLPVDVMPPDLSATLTAVTPLAPTGGEATPSLFVTPIPPQPVDVTPTPEAPQPTATPVAQPTTAPATSTNAAGQAVYTVLPGDRLFSIARVFNVNPYAIAQVNNIPAPYVIYPGQQLIIPTGTTGTPVPNPNPNPNPNPVPGRCRYTYGVKPGDNLFRISLTTGVPMPTLASANGISNYNILYVGQVLCIP